MEQMGMLEEYDDYDEAYEEGYEEYPEDSIEFVETEE